MLNYFFKISNVLFFVVLGFSSCDKQHAKKLAGNYSCTIHGNYYLQNQYYIDTHYFEDITVTQDKKFLLILDKRIHVDSLWKENKYKEGGFTKNFQAQFIDDKLNIGVGSGSQASKISIDYSCFRKK